MDEREILAALAKRIASLRKARGMTQDHLAEASGITVEGISRLERAERAPRVGTLWKVAYGLNVSPGELLNFKPTVKLVASTRRDIAALVEDLEDQSPDTVRLIHRIAKVVVDS